MKNKFFIILLLLLSNLTLCNTFDETLNILTRISREKRWAVPISLTGVLAYKGFNNKGCCTSLADVIFGKEFTFKDISLFSKLCDDNKVRIDNVDPRAPERGATPVTPADPFGAFRDDLYATLLAPTKVSINAEQQELCFDITGIYRFPLSDSWNVTGAVGIDIPIKSRLHIMDLKLYGGSLFRQVFAPAGTVRETSLFQFNEVYADVYDFFTRAILGQKNLTFEPRQRKVGIGDVSLFGLLDFVSAWDNVDAWQVGLNFVFPSGGKLKGDKVWEVVLGNGGAFQVDIFTNMIFSTESPVFNPTARFAAELSAPYTGMLRVPQKKTNDERKWAERVAGLNYPLRFRQFNVDPFNEYDTSVLWFADNAVGTRVKMGTRFIVGFGNYFYNFLTLGFRLGIFYDFLYKTEDHLCVKNQCARAIGSTKFNTKLLEELSQEKAHRIGWNLTYKFENFVELNIGSQHIFDGKNVPQLHEAFISLIAVF